MESMLRIDFPRTRRLLLLALALLLPVCSGRPVGADEPAPEEARTQRLLRAAAKARHAVVRIHWHGDKDPDDVRVRNAIVVSAAGHLLLAGPRPDWTRGTMYAEFAGGDMVKARFVTGDDPTALSLVHVSYHDLSPLRIRPEPARPARATAPVAAVHPTDAGEPKQVPPPPERPGRREDRGARLPRPLGTLPLGQHVVMVTGTGAVAEGVVRAQDRRIMLLDPDTGLPRTVGALVEAAMSVLPSDQGSPWLDEQGRVVALQLATGLSRVLPEIQERAGAGALAPRPRPSAALALPASVLRIVAPRLLARTPVLRASLGIRSHLGTEAQRAHLANGNGCHLVVDVAPGGPGDRAGLRRFDCILRVEDEPLRPLCRLVDVLLPYRPGDRIRVGILRAGKPRTLEVELARR